MRLNHSRNRLSQSGFVLLLAVLALLAVGGAILFINLGAGAASTERQIARQRASADVLLAAKLALIGYVVNPATGFRPGAFPVPDSYANGNYDGMEDPTCLGTGPNGLPGVGSSSTLKRCLGKFPWKSIGFDLGPVDQNDSLGRVPWLAVSANVVSYDNCLKVLNSDSAALDSPGSLSCSLATALPPYSQPTSLPHPWLTVVDQNGVVLSNRVAAILIMPGMPITTEDRVQRRSPSSPGQPSDYLDDINVPLGCTTGCIKYDNAGLSNIFVSIPPNSIYPGSTADASKRGQKVPFNDILIYITIDEVMPYIERRVVGEMAKAMSTFKATTNIGNYAWPAPFTTAPVTSTSFYAQPNTFFGVFPFMTDYSNGTNDYYYATDFSWNLPGANETKGSTCVRIQKTPSIYIRPTTEAESFLSYASTPANGKCQWKGFKTVDCADDETSSITRTVNSYSSITNCTNLSTPSSTMITFARRVQATLSFNIASCPKGNGAIESPLADLGRWKYTCPAATAVGAAVSVADVLASYSPVNGTPVVAATVGTSDISGMATSVNISKMRYLPILPDWYIDNLWYKTGFAALGPSFAAAPSMPCGVGVAGLTVDGSAGAQAIVMQAGRYLGAGPSPRPSATIADYFEGSNALGKGGVAPGLINCNFSNAGTAPLVTANDQVLVVSP